jgi:hypothetical protein
MPDFVRTANVENDSGTNLHHAAHELDKGAEHLVRVILEIHAELGLPLIDCIEHRFESNLRGDVPSNRRES